MEAMSATHEFVKGGMFVLVQALLYLILANSSTIFSNNRISRSFSFKPARSAAIAAVLSDFPTAADDDDTLTKPAAAVSAFKTC